MFDNILIAKIDFDKTKLQNAWSKIVRYCNDVQTMKTLFEKQRIFDEDVI